MPWHTEEEQFNCEHCGALCIYRHGKIIDMRTRMKHKCEAYLKKVRSGLINPKRTLMDLLESRKRPQFIVERLCQWCGARWVFNETMPPEDRIIHCPNCCDERGDPNGIFEHPKYGITAMIEWAKKNKKEIPKHLLVAAAKKKRMLQTRRTN